MDQVDLSKVRKQLKRLPVFVVQKLQAWAMAVETFGIREIRKVPGYHDEPLKGERAGQRSIRLTRSYRAIYAESQIGTINLIRVEEVHKHEY